jgi:hypothetical protein
MFLIFMVKSKRPSYTKIGNFEEAMTDNDKGLIHMEIRNKYSFYRLNSDRLCGLVVRVVGYRSGGPGSIPGTTRKKNVVGLERGALSLVSTN